MLTTDHKRIALLFLGSITTFFFLGGFFAMLIRLELLTPAGDLVLADTYNKLFTMHGIVMIFLFLIPSVPAVFGNFLVPMMIGAKDLAFPRLNLASWYIYMIGACFILYAILTGRRGHGLDLLHAVLDHVLEHQRDHGCAGSVYRRLLVDLYRIELHCHGASHARAGD